MSSESSPMEEPGKNPLLLIGGAALGAVLAIVVVAVMVLQAIGGNQACNPGALTINPASGPAGPPAAGAPGAR
ncbi:hypothetical protein, partial [Pseudoclavibacter helvolus]|uniref:hypothetical protein n=1 Tax=Pseudoclavibacter helvolus TaxID=255205 RepID=UPI0024ADAC8C